MYLITGVLLLLFFSSKASGINPGANLNPLIARYGRNRVQYLLLVADTLKQAGFNDTQIKLALAQVAHETGFFDELRSPFARNTNYSGIMFINNPNRHKNAVRGSAFPSAEGRYYYAKFDTPLDWAIDYKRILNLMPGKPIEQTNVSDWVNGLVSNHYFTDTSGNYKRGMQNFYDLLTDVGI